MKKTFVTIIVAVFAAAALFTGGCFSAKNVSAENADAEIVADGVTEQTDGDAGQNDVFVVQNGGHHRHKRR